MGDARSFGLPGRQGHVASTAIAAAVCLLVASCVPGDGTCSPDDPAGFWSGIWHGWVAPISLIWSFFEPHIRVYEACNSGWWYDFGFYMAIISGFGGLSLIRRRDDRG